jgi:small-conductance mechanosensitive channel
VDDVSEDRSFVSGAWGAVMRGISVLIAGFIFFFLVCGAQAAKQNAGDSSDRVSATGNLTKGESKSKEVEDKQPQAKSRHLLERHPLGFDLDTLRSLQTWISNLPSRIPDLTRNLKEQSRFLGFAGSLVLFGFLLVIVTTILAQKKLRHRFEESAGLLRQYVPLVFHPYFFSAARVLAAILIPLVLLGLCTLVESFLPYGVSWLSLLERFLKLWAVGALVINVLGETLTRGLLPVEEQNGLSLFRIARIVTIYILISLGVLAFAEFLGVPVNLLALITFVVSLSIVIALLMVFIKKKSIMALLPDLPYRTYIIFVRGLHGLYYPAVFLTFLTGILWCLGYRTLPKVLWQKTWAVVGAFLLIVTCYHLVQQQFDKWIGAKDLKDEAAKSLYKALRSLLLYLTIAAGLIVSLNLLELAEPLREILSFPVAVLGDASLSPWLFLKAGLVIITFLLFSKLLRAWLDYKVYPSIGVDEGLAYAINIFLNYFLLLIGLLLAMRAVGLDLRVLMVLAGAIGIGIGLGLQNMAANLFSSFSLVFGRRIKKGDWIQVEDTLGSVKEVGLAATRVWTRDNVELIIPNSDLTSKTIINYSLSDPMIRIHVPVGVSYRSSPEEVTRILLSAAAGNPSVSKERESALWFTEYGESSLNFELLVWIDVRKVSEKQVRSELYYVIFEAFDKAGIEIPFPQRDIHIRSGLSLPKEKPAE